MPEKKILFIGNSKKFIESFLIALNCQFYKVVPWREITKIKDLGIDYNIVVVCGYHHSSYILNFNEYYNANILDPYNFIYKNINKAVTIYYINTSLPKKNQTYSRYCYAKHKLCIMLRDEFKNLFSIDIPLLVNEKNDLDFHASFFEKKLALLILKLKKYKYIQVNELSDYLKKIIKENPEYLLGDLKAKGLRHRRTRFIDKTLRIVFG